VRILMITQFYAPTIGGQERLVEDLSIELIARGHHVAVATLEHEGQPSFGHVSGVHVHRIASTVGHFFRGYVDPSRRHAPPAVDPKAAAELRRVTRLEKPDIVHGHDWLIHSFLPLKRRHGPGLVVTLHDHSLVCANKRLIRSDEACAGPGPAKCLRCSASHYGLAKGPAIAVGNWVMSVTERALVDMFLPVSGVVADAAGLRDRGNRHLVIPNFLPTRTPIAAPKERLPGLPAEFVLFAGDVSRDKGVAVLLEAHRLLEDPPPLVLIGRITDPGVLAPAVGPERAASAALLAAPFGNVSAVGPQPHEVVLDAFRRCTVAVVPSLMPEAFGLVALEAMSAGRPVIASNIGGLREIITDGENGILVSPGDVEALRTSLARVLKDSALRARIGAAAESRARDFAADQIVPQVEQVYEDVLAARRTSRARHRPRPATTAARLRAGRTGIAKGLHRGGARAIQALTALGKSADRARPNPTAAARLSAGIRRTGRGLRRLDSYVILALIALGVGGTAIPPGAASPLRVILVLPLVLFVPGYALTSAVFGRRPPDIVERLALALSLSLVTTALVSLVLYLTSLGLTLYSWAVSLALVSAAAAVAAAARPSAAPGQSTRVLPHLALQLQRRRVEIAVTIAAAALVAAAVALARTPLASHSAPGYTALWLTQDAHSSGLILGVHSEEHRRTRYVLRLKLAGRTTRRQLTLAPGQTWQETLPPARRARALLYRDGRSGVYRSVRFAAHSTSGP